MPTRPVQLLAASFVAISTLLGCAATNREKTDAMIHDNNRAFTIASVDGDTPTRYEHRLLTAIPSVVVSPGIHTFAIEGTKQTFVAKVEPGKDYETKMQDGIPMLAEVTAGKVPSTEESRSNTPKE